MDRIEEFKNGSFYQALQDVKNVIVEIDKKTIPNKTALKGFIRIKKIIQYIDMIDWDLLTNDDLHKLNRETEQNESAGVFYIFFDHLKYCTNENFDGNWEEQMTRINGFLDNCLPTLKSILPVLILSEQDVKNIFEDYNKTIQNHLDKIDFDNSLKASEQIKDLLENRKIDRINQFFDEIFSGDENLESKKQIVYSQIENIKNRIEKFDNQQQAFTDYYDKIFGELNSETQERQGGLKNEIETLKKQIESLMPNATSVGLAKAFSDEKKKFKWTIKLWNLSFLVSIIGLLTFPLYKIFILKVDISTLENSLNFIFSSLPITLPLILLAIYCAKRRNENSMLLQEYTHKETFANSYSSYKQQIENLKGENKTLLNELLKEAISIIAKNPTTVLDKKHSSGLPVEEVQKVLENLINKSKDKD